MLHHTSTTQATAASIREAMGLKCSRSRVAGGAWRFLVRHMRYGDAEWMTTAIEQALWGIDYAVSTGRLDHTIADAIEAMSDWELCGLIAEIAENCRVQGEVSAYLIQRFAGQRAL